MTFPRDRQCPNCGDHVALLYHHDCGPLVPHEIAHCGCFHEADPATVTHHVNRDCVCFVSPARTARCVQLAQQAPTALGALACLALAARDESF